MSDITNGAAPHGGTWIRTADGAVEISVFETGVPPHFRLYFFDKAQKSVSVPNGATAIIETRRPGGAVQTFRFVVEDGYLRSTSDIPEPHEFDVKLTLTVAGSTQGYEARFTEEAHAHEHSPLEPAGHHAHDHQPRTRSGNPHGHAHDNGGGGGVLGWFKETMGHSHSAADKIDATMESHERGIWALKISLVGLAITAILQVIVVAISGSVALLADTIHNFADAGTSIPLWIAFALARRGANRRFTYGYGKTEDVAGVVIVLVIFASACVAGYEAVMKLIHPEPIHHLWWVVAAALIGFIGNEAVAVLRIRVGTEIGSAALIADGHHSRVDGFTSLSVLIGVIGVWLGVPILDPLVGIAITIAILFIVKDAATTVWRHLIEGIEPEILEQIEHAPTHVAGVQEVQGVRARWVGHKVFTEVEIGVEPTLSLREACRVADAVEKSLIEHLPTLGRAVVRARPAGELTKRVPPPDSPLERPSGHGH